MNVLVIKISSMGDIIHTLPAITDASTIIPNVLFDWVVEKNFSEIPMWHSSINQVIPINLRLWKRKWYYLSVWKEYVDYIKNVQKKKYDMIIDAQGLLKTSLFATRVAYGIKYGMDRISCTESISCLFYDKSYTIDKNQHAIERIRQLFSYSFQYSMPIYPGQYNIKHNFKKNNIQQIKKISYLLFIPFTTCSKKYWPESYWFVIISKALQLGYQIKIPYWTNQDQVCVKRFQNYFNCLIILSHLTLTEIALQILNATAVISVDTGLSHLAAALDCPNLTLYGPTDPKLIGIYGGCNQIIIQSSTKHMKHLTPQYVWKRFEDNLKYFKK